MRLLVCGGALGTSLLLSDGAGSDDVDTSAAGGGAGSDEAGALSDFSRSETGTDYAATGALDAALPRLLAGPTTEQSAPLSAGQPAQDSAAQPGTAAAPAPEQSGLLTTRAQPESAARADPALDRLRTPEGLASCLTAVLPPEDPEVRPLAVDYAVYQAQPALVVVLPADGTPDKVDVFVVGADCAVGNDATLFFTRLDRPS